MFSPPDPFQFFDRRSFQKRSEDIECSDVRRWIRVFADILLLSRKVHGKEHRRIAWTGFYVGIAFSAQIPCSSMC